MHSYRPQQHNSRPTSSPTLLPTCTACTAVSLHHTPSNRMLSWLDVLFPFHFKGCCWPCQATFLRFEAACRRHQKRPGSTSQHGPHSWHLCRCLQFAAAQRHQLVLPISANSADAIPAGTTLGPTQHHLLYVLHGISAWQGKQGTTREQQDHLLSVTQHYQQLIQTLEQATPSTTEQHWNPNPLYRLSSCDQALDSQEQTAQLAEQHPNSLLQHPAYYPTPEVSDEPADVVSAWTTFTAGAHMTGAGTIGNQRASAAAELLVQPPSSATGLACYQQCGAHTAHLASALVDANARVSTARAQLVAAQADINMLLGCCNHTAGAASAAGTAECDRPPSCHTSCSTCTSGTSGSTLASLSIE